MLEPLAKVFLHYADSTTENHICETDDGGYAICDAENKPDTMSGFFGRTEDAIDAIKNAFHFDDCVITVIEQVCDCVKCGNPIWSNDGRVLVYWPEDGRGFGEGSAHLKCASPEEIKDHWAILSGNMCTCAHLITDHTNLGRCAAEGSECKCVAFEALEG